MIGKWHGKITFLYMSAFHFETGMDIVIYSFTVRRNDTGAMTDGNYFATSVSRKQ